jgi:paraquat-inducible protein A
MIACHECDLHLILPELEENQKAHCPRCNYILTSRHRDTVNRILAFSVSGIIFLILAFLFPFIVFKAQGIERVINLQQSIDILFYKDYASLAILIYFLTIVFPCIILAGSFYVSIAIKRHQLLPATRTIMRLLVLLQPWSMVEIYLIGILVSFIKIISLADVSLGLSFSAYVLFSLCLTIVLLHLDKYQFWLKINNINTQNR